MGRVVLAGGVAGVQLVLVVVKGVRGSSLALVFVSCCLFVLCEGLPFSCCCFLS